MLLQFRSIIIRQKVGIFKLLSCGIFFGFVPWSDFPSVHWVRAWVSELKLYSSNLQLRLKQFGPISEISESEKKLKRESRWVNREPNKMAKISHLF